MQSEKVGSLPKPCVCESFSALGCPLNATREEETLEKETRRGKLIETARECNCFQRV